MPLSCLLNISGIAWQVCGFSNKSEAFSAKAPDSLLTTRVPAALCRVTIIHGKATAFAVCLFIPLLAQAELCNQGAVALDILLLQVGQKVAAAADHLQQAAAAVVVIFVGLQVAR